MVVQEIKFMVVGKWIGMFFQFDCDYGFYFEVDLGLCGLGGFYIVFEGNGGSVYMDFEYIYNVNSNELYFQEGFVIKKEDLAWLWCIKLGDLVY